MKVRVSDEAVLSAEPPPPRVPRPVEVRATTHGHRLVTSTPEGYRRDIRGYGNPYYVHVPTGSRWERDATPPEGLSVDDPDVWVVVDACTESAWYVWRYGGRDPAEQRGGVQTLNARLTWIE